MTKPATWTPNAETALDRIEGKLFATTTEVCAIFGYDPRTLRKGIEAGEVPGIRVGQQWRIPTAWVREQAQIGETPSEIRWWGM